MITALAAGAVLGSVAGLTVDEPVIEQPRMFTPQGGSPECNPAGSLMRGREGRVVVTLIIRSDGSVGSFQLPPARRLGWRLRRVVR